MSHEIDVDADDPELAERLRADAAVLMDALQMQRCELSVVLTDDEAIAVLNAQWRGKQGPTDVLSFPQGAETWVGVHVGDIVISTETAARQAADIGHGLYDELAVLLAHGLCHLIGHDHLEPEETAAMLAVEQSLLAALDREEGLIHRTR